MKNYPINLEDRLADLETELNEPIEDMGKKFISMITELENQAYEQGRKDGFLQSFRSVEKTRDIPDPDPELSDLLRKLREELEAAFEHDGCDTVFNNVGMPPDDVSFGERVYVLMQEAFVVGGVHVLFQNEEKQETDSQ